MKPGADELRIRHILRERGVGPDAMPTAEEPPEDQDRDWLDEILDGNATPPPDEPVDEAEPDPPQPPAAPAAKAPTSKPQKRKRKRKRKKRRPRDPAAPRTAFDHRPESPRQSLLDAWDRVPYRLKWLGYHVGAAYLGWMVGLVDYATYVTAWIASTGLVGPQAFFWYGAATATALLYAHTRGWWWPAGYLTAVPVCSIVVGVLLYGTGYHH